MRNSGMYSGLQITERVCSGTIVSNNKIVTTADCVDGAQSIVLAVATTNSDEPYKRIKVSAGEIIKHPFYNRSNSYMNNIAVILLRTALKTGSKVGTINMVNRNYVARSGGDVLLLGYPDPSGISSRKYTDTQLRKLNSTIADFDVCNSMYEFSLAERQQFCIILNDGEHRKFTGGKSNCRFAMKIGENVLNSILAPVITRDSKFAGFISHHEQEGFPEICTQISHHLDFIANPRVSELMS